MPKKRTRQKNQIIPFAIMAVGLLIVAAAIFFSQQQALVQVSPTAANNTLPFSQVPRVSLADAKAAFDIGSAIFVDVRGEPYYTTSHIKGAISITEADLDSGLAQLNPQDWIITYCT